MTNAPRKDILPEIYYKLGELLKRLKVVEERLHSLADRVENINNELLDFKKSTVKFRTDINKDLEKINKEIVSINEKIRYFEKELPRLAKKSELEVLNKVFSLWDPMKFVSLKEFNYLVEDKLEEFEKKILEKIGKSEKIEEKEKKKEEEKEEDNKNISTFLRLPKPNR